MPGFCVGWELQLKGGGGGGGGGAHVGVLKFVLFYCCCF